MGGFRVGLDHLSELIGRLDRAADQISSANNQLREASESQLGHGDLDSACAEFQERWEYGIGRIRESTERLVPSLQQARRTYAEADVFRLEGVGGGEAGGQAAGSPTGGSISAALEGR